ncbi:hypothetical protein HYW17_02125 [Candidatus Uhrbacteria bacterium]|nr:hypothetical protein [Candidatus Uhrbacteria bacterium]
MPTPGDEKKPKQERPQGPETLEEAAARAAGVARAGREKAAGAALAEAEKAWDPDKFLAQLTSYQDNPQLPDYEEKMDALGDQFQEFGEQYADRWQEMIEQGLGGTPEMVAVLREKLRGKLLVDLGGGYTLGDGPRGIMQSIMQDVALELGVKDYVNVDRHFTKRRVSAFFNPTDVTRRLGIEQPRGMHALYVQADMLAFLAHMQSETPNLTIALNGIDSFVIPDRARFGRGDSYFQMLVKEIARVLPKGGVVLTQGSEDATKYFDDAVFEAAPGYSKEKGAMFEGQVWVKK